MKGSARDFDDVEYETGSVPEQMQKNYAIINGLEDLVSRLEERISPVLKPENDMKSPGESDSLQPVRSPLADDLAQQHVRLQKLTTRVAGVLMRVNL